MARVRRCQSVHGGPWDEVGCTDTLYLTASLGEPAASDAPAAGAETSERAAAAADLAPGFELLSLNTRVPRHPSLSRLFFIQLELLE